MNLRCIDVIIMFLIVWTRCFINSKCSYVRREVIARLKFCKPCHHISNGTHSSSNTFINTKLYSYSEFVPKPKQFTAFFASLRKIYRQKLAQLKVLLKINFIIK